MPVAPDVIARHVEVRGRVQGVWFRASCRDEARRLEVTGWVANRSDGSVEAHFEGPPAGVEALVDWCRGGPPGAQVVEVVVGQAHPQSYLTFEIR